MFDFLKFMLKCLWEGSGYVFSSTPATASEKPFDSLGISGFGILFSAFVLFDWLIVKCESSILRHTVSALITLSVVVVYFLIAYCFVR